MKDAAQSAPSVSARQKVATRPRHPPGGGTAVIGVGDTVVHAKFGKGKVIALGSAPNEKPPCFSLPWASVLLKFAKLDVLG